MRACLPQILRGLGDICCPPLKTERVVRDENVVCEEEEVKNRLVGV